MVNKKFYSDKMYFIFDQLPAEVNMMINEHLCLITEIEHYDFWIKFLESSRVLALGKFMKMIRLGIYFGMENEIRVQKCDNCDYIIIYSEHSQAQIKKMLRENHVFLMDSDMIAVFNRCVKCHPLYHF